MDGKTPLKISELVCRLNKIKEEKGDIEVFFHSYDSPIFPLTWIEIATDLTNDFIFLQNYME